jgi:hypothetical protein
MEETMPSEHSDDHQGYTDWTGTVAEQESHKCGQLADKVAILIKNGKLIRNEKQILNLA